MKKIGFIGLGVMGEPMAANLIRKGFELKVYNRTTEKTAELAKLGAQVALSPAEAAQHVDVVITMISDDNAIREVYYGEEGILDAVQPGTTVIDSSTISPALSVQLAEDLQDKFCYFLDAPVTGSKPGAVNGTLLFMVGGDAQIIDEHRDVLLAMGKEIIHTGKNGSGSTAKLAHNTVVAINMAGIVEGMSIAAKGGIDPSDFLKIIQAGNASSKLADLKGEKILNRDYSVQFALGLMLKDLKLASGLTDHLGLSSPVLGTVKNVFQMGQAAGHGESDLSALMLVYEEWIGKRIAKEESPASSAKTEPSSAMNRRKAPRVPIHIPVMISLYQWQQEGNFSGQSVEGILNDVSAEGLQITCSFPLEKDMFVVIHMPHEAGLPPMIGRIIRIQKHHDQFQYGCLLSALPLYQKVQLEEYIKQHTS